MKNKSYDFTSERLGFRNWQVSDVSKMAKISGDKEVMEHFPAVATNEQTKIFTHKLMQLYKEKKYCYFAVEELISDELIGFIGFYDQDYESDFTPAVDIGWRLDKRFWNKGYASEGAKRCLEYGKNTLNLTYVIATAPQVNSKSIHIMKKIGMTKKLDFVHPRLKNIERLKNCVCYEVFL